MPASRAASRLTRQKKCDCPARLDAGRPCLRDPRFRPLLARCSPATRPLLNVRSDPVRRLPHVPDQGLSSGSGAEKKRALKIPLNEHQLAPPRGFRSHVRTSFHLMGTGAGLSRQRLVEQAVNAKTGPTWARQALRRNSCGAAARLAGDCISGPERPGRDGLPVPLVAIREAARRVPAPSVAPSKPRSGRGLCRAASLVSGLQVPVAVPVSNREAP